MGRSKDLIISGGYNVYPAEIEGFINELPGVAESALVGVPHADFGEVGVAVVIAKPGATLLWVIEQRGKRFTYRFELEFVMTLNLHVSRLEKHH